MPLPSQTTVLIVGAGPCGMAAALSLHHQGCRDILIVDSIMAGENSSRAIVIHAATLEALDTIGCADPLVALGDKADRFGFLDGKTYLASTDFTLLSPYTRFPFGLIIPQSSTEAVLLEKLQNLGIKVSRPYKAISMTTSTDHENMVAVRFESGETVRAKYVIGADGAKSVIRNEAGISFKDPDGNHDDDYGVLSQMVVGDVVFSTPPKLPSPSGIFGILSPKNFVLLAAFPAARSPDKERTVYRLISGVSPAEGNPPQAPSSEYCQSIVDRYALQSISDPALGAQQLRVEKTYWSARFRTRSAIADCFYKRLDSGAVLLIGDAAHIHSPVGGQGLSLGIRDAITLGPALVGYAQGAGRDTLLNRWAAERRAHALGVIGLTKRTMAMFNMGQGQGYFAWMMRWVGGMLVRILTRFKFYRRMLAWRVSGLGEI
ncbi:FAD/NAD-P-binding domain-containing protein [Mycena polygramma]|nr:FAD/NAD-P-binding domain-containing protein [Mycena polygramma]